MDQKVTRRRLLYAGLALPLFGGCGGGSGSAATGTGADAGNGTRGTLALTMNFQASRAAGTPGRTRAFNGFIPIGTRAVLVQVFDPDSGAEIAPSQLVTAPLARAGLPAIVVSVQFMSLRVGPVRVRATAFPDAAGKKTPIASGSATGQIAASTTTNLAVNFSLTLAKLAATPANVSVSDISTQQSNIATVTATIVDSANRALQLPVFWLSRDPGIATVGFDVSNPTVATVTGIAFGATLITVVEPNSGMTATVNVDSGNPG